MNDDLYKGSDNSLGNRDWWSQLNAKQTLIMGIINLTPDSFSDGGQCNSIETATAQALRMQEEGADFLDIGAESSRPGAAPIDAATELKRLLPILKVLLSQSDLPISVDTYKADVAREALKMGTPIINDIWGLQKDPAMAGTIAEYQAGVIIMHNQEGTEYQTDIMSSVIEFFNRSIDIAITAGIDSQKIILDPGIGFGKDTAQNLEVLARMKELNTLNYPILLGTSRKSVIGNTLNLPVDERIEGTLATTTHGIVAGAKIIRVHDVKENKRNAMMTDAILNQK